MKKTIGVLGGMGPYATLAFFKKMLDFTYAGKDWDHARLVIDNNPHIPSRTRHFQYGEASPLEGMIDSCRRLQEYPVDMIAIPCNSAQAWRREVAAAIDVPIPDIMQITVDAVEEQFPETKAIAVLGGRVTWGKRTYAPYAEAHGFLYLDLEFEIQTRVEQMIERIKLQHDLPSAVAEVKAILADITKRHDTASIIFGCTEFGCISDALSGFHWIDSATEYARTLVALSGVRCR